MSGCFVKFSSQSLAMQALQMAQDEGIPAEMAKSSMSSLSTRVAAPATSAAPVQNGYVQNGYVDDDREPWGYSGSWAGSSVSSSRAGQQDDDSYSRGGDGAPSAKRPRIP